MTGECEICGGVREVQIVNYLGFDHMLCARCVEREEKTKADLPWAQMTMLHAKATALVALIDDHMRRSALALTHTLHGKPEEASKEMKVVRALDEQIKRLRKEIGDIE